MYVRSCALVPTLLAGASFGQALKIDLNSHFGVPSASHLPTPHSVEGQWNGVDTFSANDPPVELVGLDGTPSGVFLSMPLSTTAPVAVHATDPVVTGDNLALHDDGFAAGQSPERIRLDGLEDQWYFIMSFGPASIEAPTSITFRANFLSKAFYSYTGGWNAGSSASQWGVNYVSTTLYVEGGWLEIDWKANSATHDGVLSAVQIVPWCYADCTQDGGLDIFDWICFGSEYGAAYYRADCDQNQVLNIFDYICFGNAYAAGCP